MNFKYSLFAIISFIIFNIDAVVESGVPDTITKCHYEESSCLVKSIQYALKTYAQTGIRELNVRPFDPMHIKSIKLAKNPASPVNIELKLKDSDIVGLKDAKILKVEGFDANLKKIVEINALAEELTMRGPYSINGRVLILPIVGEGNAKMTFSNLKINAKFRPKLIQKKGRNYLHLESTKLHLTPTRVTFNLENLFNGDKALGDNMNLFMNENWSDIFGELREDFGEAIGLVLTHYINEAFAKLPYDEFFLN